MFGASFVGGMLIGAIMSAIMLALYTGNAGGAWDNGKKYIESGGLNGHSKGGETHAAAVVGDTVGDPQGYRWPVARHLNQDHVHHFSDSSRSILQVQSLRSVEQAVLVKSPLACVTVRASGDFLRERCISERGNQILIWKTGIFLF